MTWPVLPELLLKRTSTRKARCCSQQNSPKLSRISVGYGGCSTCFHKQYSTRTHPNHTRHLNDKGTAFIHRFPNFFRLLCASDGILKHEVICSLLIRPHELLEPLRLTSFSFWRLQRDEVSFSSAIAVCENWQLLGCQENWAGRAWAGVDERTDGSG